MELQLQFGFGMMEHCRVLLSRWGGGTVILSPRDLTPEQLGRFATSILDLGNTRVLVDPQFYVPHADHERLCSHEFWPANYQTGTFWQGPDLRLLIRTLADLNRDLGTASFVLPGMLATRIDGDWLAIHEAILQEAIRADSGQPLMMTVALSAESARDVDQIGTLLERSEAWRADSFYLVAEHPNGQYLVEDANWLANVIDLAAGLRLLGKEVRIGYCNHQMLIASLAKVSAIASGTWMNVRSFPPEKFVIDYEEEMKQRAIWYYSPQALSEYKIPFLDIAARQGVLDRMAPAPRRDGGYATALFGGAQPSSVGFNEQLAFRHYLYALHTQATDVAYSSFDEALDGQRRLLDEADELLRVLRGAGIRGQQRDFTEIVDINRAALELFATLRGPMLRHRWGSL